ncbi:oxidoreductase [Burkholderia lata]|uniref:Short-chain dehydrogenase/reductase SDR n=1 Tax=Burkholderia lata (strain ATCC 17760 / DSM 23089 / LMG 22485 / NCIMB 9086 / R18194 / 383) TaxID=482957 RepID=Q397S1_BURL3|nr:oxidoreductase [Burkholderia lata]ABB11290.1 Short-chain dehydrogenase/reductase SDR [Burkholderia lata]
MSKVWFITGASSGFGRALAEAVLAAGDNAVLAARRGDALDAIVGRHGDRALAVSMDVTNADARQRAVRAALERFGRVDVLANIAGRGSCGAAEEFSGEQLREQLELNFIAPVELTREVLPHMRARGTGHILNLTSIAGLAPIPACALYCAAKFALEGWSETLHQEVGPLGIRVTIVEPGGFRTEFNGAAIMRPGQTIDAYRPTVEPILQFLESESGRQPGDPDKAARLMIEAVNSDTPPLRLMLGADAYQLWEKTAAARDADISAWREKGEATAYDDAQLTPIGGA